jgi:hypothetical protein
MGSSLDLSNNINNNMRIKEVLSETSALNKLQDPVEYQNALASFKEYYGDVEGEKNLMAYINAVNALIQNGGTIYRAVWVLPGKKPRLKDPGDHWTISPESAENYLETESGDAERIMAIPNGSDEEPVPYILSAKIGPNNITFNPKKIATFPWEQEVSLVNRSAAKVSIFKKSDYIP